MQHIHFRNSSWHYSRVGLPRPGWQPQPEVGHRDARALLGLQARLDVGGLLAELARPGESGSTDIRAVGVVLSGFWCVLNF